MAETRFHLAGHVFALRSGGPKAPIPDPIYGPFRAPPNIRPAAAYDIAERIPLLPRTHAVRALWAGPTWQLLDEGNGFCRINARLPDDSIVTLARVARDFSAGSMAPIDVRTGLPSEFATAYPADRIIFTRRLAQLGCMTLHASGVIMNDKAWLFCGPAGIGKSTIASIWTQRGAVLMNDERMFIRTDSMRILASAAPWYGKNPPGALAPAPLDAIFLLSQAAEHRLTSMKPAEATARILANGICPFCSESGMQSLLEAADRLVGSVPVYSLAFRPTADVVDLCLGTARAQPTLL